MADKIVVGYDGSEHAKRALNMAIEWAGQTPDSEIIITCAQERPEPAVGFRGMDVVTEELYEGLVKQIEKDLADAAAVCEKAGVQAATVCTADAPDVGIARVAREASARMIVVGVKGEGARMGQRTQLGSTTNRLLHEAGGDIPILVV